MKNCKNFYHAKFCFCFCFDNAKNLNNAVNKEQKWLQVCKWYRWLCKCRKNGGKEAGFRRENKVKKQFADRGYGADSRGRTAGWKAKVVRRSRV